VTGLVSDIAGSVTTIELDEPAANAANRQCAPGRIGPSDAVPLSGKLGWGRHAGCQAAVAGRSLVSTVCGAMLGPALCTVTLSTPAPVAENARVAWICRSAGSWLSGTRPPSRSGATTGETVSCSPGRRSSGVVAVPIAGSSSASPWKTAKATTWQMSP
jgi:hypothetical protein